MRKNLIYAGLLLLGLTVATSCSNEESLEQVMNNGNTFEAVIENVEARTSVNDAYQVLWTTDDAFNVFENGEKKATLTLSEGNGTTSGKFTIDNSGVTITEDMVALFPASESLNYTFATEYTSQETDAPMSAKFANGKFTFSLLTAMVRVVVADVPAGNVEMTISNKDQILTGVAALNNGTLAVPTQGDKSVSVSITTNEAGTLTFDVPVPVQNYTNGLSVVVKSGNTEVLNKTTNSFDATAGNLYLFGATYVTAENAATTLQEALNGCAEGDVVMLTGDAEEVTVPSLTLDQTTTATLDLNGKTLNLGESTTGRSTSATYGLINNGTLTIKNGTVNYDYPGEYDGYGKTYNEISAIVNKGVLTLENTNVTSDVWAIKTFGTWTDNVTLANQGEPTVKTTINGGTIKSNESAAHATDGKHIYAVANVDNALLTVTGNAIIEGDGCIYVACSKVNVEGATLTAKCTTSGNCIYMEWAGIVTTTDATQMTAASGVKVVAADNSNGEYGGIVYNENSLSTGNIVVPEEMVVSLVGSTLTGKIENNGTLTIKNGTVNYDYPGEYDGYGKTYNEISAIVNKGVLTLENTNVTSDVWAIKAFGTWTDNVTLANQGEPTVKTTINGGTIKSNESAAHAADGKHIYAVANVDNALLTVTGNATIEGDGCIYVACSKVNVEDATLTAKCTTSGNCIYMEWAGIVTTTDATQMTASSGAKVVAADNSDGEYGAMTYNNEDKTSGVVVE